MSDINMAEEGISLLCPTRGRPGLLVASVRMALTLAARPERIEILIRVDNDDPVDYREVWSKFGPRGAKPVRGKLIGGERKGYERLFEYYNQLSQLAIGRWLGLWNDDIMVATPNWDLELDKVKDEVAVAMTESNHGRSPCTFPLWTRKMTELIGHVSLSAHNDTWTEEVGAGAEIQIPVPILLLHCMQDDQTAKEGKAEGRIEKTSAHHYSEEMTAARAEDVKKIREYLDAKP